MWGIQKNYRMKKQWVRLKGKERLPLQILSMPVRRPWGGDGSGAPERQMEKQRATKKTQGFCPKKDDTLYRNKSF